MEFLESYNLGLNVNLKNRGRPKGGPKILVYVYIYIYIFPIGAVWAPIQKVQVDILAKVLYFKEFFQKSSFGKWYGAL